MTESLSANFTCAGYNIDPINPTFLQIETIGDAYVVAAGVPDSDPYSAVAAAVMAVSMNLSVHTVQMEFLKAPIVCRIG